MTPEIQARIAIWRRKAIDGTLSDEEMKEAVDLLRAGRVTAAAASAASRSKRAVKIIPSADDLLDELKDL